MKIHIEWKEQYICMKGDYFMADFVAGAACSRRDPDPFPKDPVAGHIGVVEKLKQKVIEKIGNILPASAERDSLKL